MRILVKKVKLLNVLQNKTQFTVQYVAHYLTSCFAMTDVVPNLETNSIYGN